MTTTWHTDEQVRRLVCEVAELRTDLQRLQSDIELREHRRRIDREIHIQMVIIIVSFAMMGVMMAVLVVALR